MPNSENSKKVLVLALSGIGNFLMQSPAVEALKKAHPRWHITVWVSPRGTRILAKHNPNTDEVIEESLKRSFLNHIRLIWRLRRQKFDIGIVLSPGQLLKSALSLFLVGIPKRIGHEYPFLGRETSFFLTDSIPENPSLHDIEQNLQLLQCLDIRHLGLDIRHYSVSIPLKYQKRSDNLLKSLKVPTTKHILGLHPGSAPNFLWKRWSLSNFAALAQYFVNRNYHILIFGGRDEAKLKRKLKGRLGSDATIIETDLLTTAAIMQKCKFFVSNDSGLMHLAAATGVKTFGLFGPTDERQTGPRGQNSYAIRASGTEPVYHTEKNFDLGTKPHETLRALTVEEVLVAIER